MAVKKRKIAVCVMLLLLMCFSTAAAVMVTGAYTEGDYEYLRTPSGAAVVYFNGDPATQVLHIPDTLGGLPVTSLEWGAFGSLHQLREVFIPDSVLSVKDEAFLNCTGLETVHIGKRVRLMEGNPFDGCVSLKNIDLPEENAAFSLVSGALIEKSEMRLVCWPGGRTQKEYLVPAGVRVIGDSAFCGKKNLQTVVIPESVHSVHATAFNDGYGQRMDVLLDIRGSQAAHAYAQKNGMRFTYEPTEEEVQQQQYEQGVQLMQQGRLDEAKALFEQLPDHEGAQQRAQICQLLLLPVGHTVQLGHWEQNGSAEDGMEPIEWVVAQQQQGDLLLICKSFLTQRAFHVGNSDVAWKTSDLRKWLNEDFLQTAFDAHEQAMLGRRTIVSHSPSQSQTRDIVFVPSEEEIQAMLPFFDLPARAHGVKDTTWSWLRDTNGASMAQAWVWKQKKVSMFAAAQRLPVMPAVYVRYDLLRQQLLDAADMDGAVYQAAAAAFDAEDYDEAHRLFGLIRGYGDAQQRCDQTDEIIRSLIKPGVHIFFGHYEQDDDLANGPDPIEWIVLDREDDRALAITKDMIIAPTVDNYPTGETVTYPYIYHQGYDKWVNSIDTTWEKSVLRSSLNTLFLEEAFTPEEQRAIHLAQVEAEARPFGATSADAGADTQDRIFILSASEVSRYMPMTGDRETQYSKTIEKRQTYWQTKSVEKRWMLRHPTIYSRQGHNQVFGVDENGQFTEKLQNTSPIRPACWIDLQKAGDLVRRAEPETIIDQWTVGEQVTFGRFEQDNSPSNGDEPLQWVVIAREGNRALLLSRHVLAAMKYSKNATSTYENSTMREWMNTVFVPSAFNEEEAAALAQRTATPVRSAEGRHVQDKAFVLSREEVEKYLPATASRIAAPTAVAQRQGSGYINKLGDCWWWLRSSTKGTKYANTVRNDGTFDNRSVNFATLLGVRPAVWVNLDRLAP